MWSAGSRKMFAVHPVTNLKQRPYVATLCYFYCTNWLCCDNLAKLQQAANTKKKPRHELSNQLEQETIKYNRKLLEDLHLTLRSAPTYLMISGSSESGLCTKQRFYLKCKLAFKSFSLLSCRSSSSSSRSFFLSSLSQ